MEFYGDLMVNEWNSMRELIELQRDLAKLVEISGLGIGFMVETVCVPKRL